MTVNRYARMAKAPSRVTWAAGVAVALTLGLVIAWQTQVGKPERGAASKPVLQAGNENASGHPAGIVVWNPNIDPFGPGSKEVTLQQAEATAGYPFYPPDTPEASPSTITHVWVGVEPPAGQNTLPSFAQTTVAMSFSSGIQVTVEPWVYGIDAPPFSEQAMAQSYQTAASQGAGISAGSIDGIPVRFEEASSAGAGWVEFNLGTSNANALDIAVMGKLPMSQLDSVAGSIISQWEKANPGVAG